MTSTAALRRATPEDAALVKRIVDTARETWPGHDPETAEYIAHEIRGGEVQYDLHGDPHSEDAALFTYAHATSTFLFTGYPHVPTHDPVREERLLRAAERQARERGLPIEVAVPEARAKEVALLERLGYRQVRRFARMYLTGDALQAIQAPELPPGAHPEHATAERYRPVYNAAFSSHYGFSPVTAETVGKWYAEPEFRADDWWVLSMNGADVAHASIGMKDGTGWVYQLGTHPDHQQKGYGRLMLTHAVYVLRERGAHTVRLGVDQHNAHDALSFYTRVGFQLDYTTLRYRKEHENL